MQCYSSIAIIQNGERYYVPCQKCNFCLQNRRNDWAFRLLEEQKVSSTANFLTLTYDNEHVPFVWENDYPLELTLEKKHLYTFHETIKKSQKRLLKKSYKDWKIRYYSVGEYGTKTDRPHYHSIMFNIHPDILGKLNEGQIWSKGHVYMGTVTPGSAAYVAKYMIDRELHNDRKRQKQFSSMSRNPGIGNSYLINRAWHRENDDYNPDNFRIYAIQDGKKVRLPRYYKDKIFKEIDEKFKDVMKTSLELHYMELSEQFENTYIREIERLAGLHPEPVAYYNERRKNHHDNIRKKSLSLNKI